MLNKDKESEESNSTIGVKQKPKIIGRLYEGNRLVVKRERPKLTGYRKNFGVPHKRKELKYMPVFNEHRQLKG